MGLGRLALPVAVLTARLVPSSEGYALNIRPASAATAAAVAAREQSHCCLRLKSATTEAAEGESTSGTQSLLRRDSWPASKRRRVKSAIKRRARRLARVRKKNKARQDALELATVNDVARVADTTYFPARRSGRAAAAAAPAAAEQDIAGGDVLGVAGISAATETADTGAPSYKIADTPAATLAPTSTRRNEKHATIKGRPIVKGGKGRGLWRSIFGPKPLLEVHSLDQLSQLVDVEGWGLEDLSVLTDGGARSTEGVTALDTSVDAIAAAGAAGDNAMPEEETSGSAANNRTKSLRTPSGGAKDLDLEQAREPATATISSSSKEQETEEEEAEEEEDRADDQGDGIHVPANATPPLLPSLQEQQQQPLHPAVRAVLDRAAAGTAPSLHRDGRRIGLAIEGGGMRGCVAAGMASCLHFLGLADSFDCVYGASAGSLIGAYFVSRQANGTAVYHDILPSAGSRFIDMAKFPQALGFELPKVSSKKGTAGAAGKEAGGGKELSALKAARAASFARVIGLDFLLGDVVGRVHALDFDAFRANDKLQPLHVVASGVSSMRTVSLASRRGHFSTLDELTGCIRASMLVPGLAGPLLSVAKRRRRQQQRPESLVAGSVVTPPSADGVADGDVGTSSAASQAQQRKKRLSFLRRAERRNKAAAAAAAQGGGGVAVEGSAGGDDATELLVDAMVFEPLPYRSAMEDGCTDVVVLCTRPKGSQVLGKKPSIYETRVVKKFFEQHDDPATTSGISDYVQKLQHLRVYAEDALVLGEGSRTGVPQPAPKGGPGDGREAFMVAIAPDASCKEVGQLEMDRRAILQGCRDGFAACYDTFVGGATALVSEGGDGGLGDDGAGAAGLVTMSGAEAAMEYFPDSLLSTPADLNATYFETGFKISDRQQKKPSPLAPNGDRTNGASELNGRFARGVVEGGLSTELERLLLFNGDDEGATAGAAAATAAAVKGIGAAAPAGLAGVKVSTSNGARGLLRRLLSRGKLRPSSQASSSGDAGEAASATEAVAVEEDSRETRTVVATDPIW